METIDYAESAVLAQQLKDELDKYEDMSYWSNVANNVFVASMHILRGELQDPNNALYYAMGQMRKALYSTEYKKAKSLAKKLRDELMPESERIKKHNEELLYQAYKWYN